MICFLCISLHTEQSVFNLKIMKHTKIINSLLIISAINLTLMIPGGFIESRDFSHISSIILGGFNVFLTTLGMVSLFLVYFIYKKQKWAVYTAFITGVSYFIVYTIDLAKIFPKSPTPMSSTLFYLEILGTIIAIPIMFYSVKKLKELENNNSKLLLNKSIYWLTVIAGLIGLGIIIFATKSAMTGK